MTNFRKCRQCAFGYKEAVFIGLVWKKWPTLHPTPLGTWWFKTGRKPVMLYNITLKWESLMLKCKVQVYKCVFQSSWHASRRVLFLCLYYWTQNGTNEPHLSDNVAWWRHSVSLSAEQFVLAPYCIPLNQRWAINFPRGCMRNQD